MSIPTLNTGQRPSRRQYAGDSLAPVEAEALGGVVRRLMEAGRSEADPFARGTEAAVPRDAVPRDDMYGAGVRRRPNTIDEILSRLPSADLSGRSRLGPTSPNGAPMTPAADGAPQMAAATPQERYPGLQGAMPAAFTPEQTEQTLESLRRNDRTGHFLVDPGDSRAPGQTPTRAESQWERDSMDRQMASTLDTDTARRQGQTFDAESLLQAKRVADAKAALRWSERYGVPYDKDLAKYTSEAEREMALDDDHDAMEKKLDAKREQGLYMDPQDFALWSDPIRRSQLPPEQRAAIKTREETNYLKAKREAAIHWAMRRKAPGEYLQSLQAPGFGE